MEPSLSQLKLLEPPSLERLAPDFGLWVWPVAVLIALVAFFVLRSWLVRRRSRKQAAPDAADSAFSAAVAELNRIKTAAPPDAAHQISLALRKYVYAATNDRALYETNEEFTQRAASPSASPRQEQIIDELTKLAEAKYKQNARLDNIEGATAEVAELIAALRRQTS